MNGYNPKDNKDLLFSLREVIVDHIENKDVHTFITGMALGIDMWAARIVFKLKETYPHIKVIAAVPCDKQYNKWPEKSQQEWKAVIQRCDDVHYVSNDTYTHWCMQKRNEWMVDNADYVIAVWDGTKGGTANCVNYAVKEGKQTTQLHPKTLVVS